MAKKNNNITIYIFIIIGIVCLIISLFLTLSKNIIIDNHIIEINYDSYREIIKKNEYSIIILTSATCQHCKNYKPAVNRVANDYNITVYDLNVNSLSYNEYLEIHDKYIALKDSYSNGRPSILIPTTIITKNGEEVDSILNDIGYNGLVSWFKKNDIIK